MTAGGRRCGRLGGPTPWGGESRSPGLWDKDPVSLPGGRGRTAPRSWGPRLPGRYAPGGLRPSAPRGRRGQPGKTGPGEGSLGWGYQLLRPGGGWGATWRAGGGGGARVPDAARVGRRKKEFLVNPFSGDPSGLRTRRGSAWGGLRRDAEGSN